MYNDFAITADSFGSTCPYNWETIAEYLNNKIDESEEEYSTELVNKVWENYWNGVYPDAPVAISDENSDKELLKALDDVDSWNDEIVEPVAKELCRRTGIDFDSYDEYDLLYDALEKAINS